MRAARADDFRPGVLQLGLRVQRNALDQYSDQTEIRPSPGGIVFKILACLVRVGVAVGHVPGVLRLIDVFPDRHSAEGVFHRASDRVFTVIPDFLSVQREHELDERGCGCRIRRAAQKLNRVGGHGSAVFRIHESHPVGAAALYRRPFRFGSAVEVNADTGGGAATGDVMRHLAGGVGYITGVGGNPLNQVHAVGPSAS